MPAAVLRAPRSAGNRDSRACAPGRAIALARLSSRMIRSLDLQAIHAQRLGVGDLEPFAALNNADPIAALREAESKFAESRN
jgi:hypothetical protein